MPKPVKYTSPEEIAELKDKIFEWAKSGRNTNAIRALAGISHKRWSVLIQENPELIDAVYSARASRVGEVRKALIDRALGGFTWIRKERYTVDDEGNEKLVEVNRTQIFTPPDTNALALYLTNYDDGFSKEKPREEIQVERLELEKDELNKKY